MARDQGGMQQTFQKLVLVLPCLWSCLPVSEQEEGAEANTQGMSEIFSKSLHSCQTAASLPNTLAVPTLAHVQGI